MFFVGGWGSTVNVQLDAIQSPAELSMTTPLASSICDDYDGGSFVDVDQQTRNRPLADALAPMHYCSLCRSAQPMYSIVRWYTPLTNWSATSTPLIRQDRRYSVRRPKFGDLLPRWGRTQTWPGLFAQSLALFYAYVNNCVQVAKPNC